ncbi:hypothetical protein ASD64_09530 [Mesorhizobium sp. Root157]|nr:hypothetical protein ASD64_09530 [Mesorhizobium sp. Root157]
MNTIQKPAQKPALTYTGERYHPELLDEIRQEHIHRYLWALGLVGGLDVLDLACGEGFGSAMLAGVARRVVGIDVSDAAIRHAGARYQAQNLSFICADAVDLPLADRSVDVVVSFETVEHLADQAGMMSEIRRVLRPEGFLIMSSPNTAVYSQRQGHNNEFHVHELTGKDFENLLETQFPVRRLYGQRLSVASSILSCHDDTGGVASVFRDGDSVEQSSRAIPDTMYYLAVAAAHENCLPTLEGSFLVSASYDVYWKIRDEAMSLRAEIGRQSEEAKRLSAEKDRLATETELLTAEKDRLAEEANHLRAARDALAADIPALEDMLRLAGEYLANGAGEEREPSPLFDSDYYLASNPDVAESGMDPLVHYLLFGRKEGRLPTRPACVETNQGQTRKMHENSGK